jgi:hypothetical protein
VRLHLNFRDCETTLCQLKRLSPLALLARCKLICTPNSLLKVGSMESFVQERQYWVHPLRVLPCVVLCCLFLIPHVPLVILPSLSYSFTISPDASAVQFM